MKFSLLALSALVATVHGCATTVSSYSSVSAAKASCTAITIKSMAVPAGKTLDLTGLKSGTTVTFSGTTTFAYSAWAGPLISVSGTNIVVTGGTLDGNGAKYWDGKGSNGGVTKPKFFQAHKMLGSSKITSMKILNAPVQCFSIQGSTGLTISSVTIDNTAGASLGHNTDCFDIGSQDSLTLSSNNCYSQDDCMAINSGTNIKVSGMYCSGTHGLSIGSVGGRSDNTVKTVTISGSTVTGGENGVRIKTVYGATGSVSGVTYSSIKLSSLTKYGVVIEQDYENGSPTGTPTNGVPITGLTLSSVTGSVSSSARAYYILCGSGSCSGWTFSGVSVTGGKGNSCNYKPSGFSC